MLPWTEPGQLLGQAPLPTLVQLDLQRPHESGLLLAAAPEHQGLVQGALEAVVALLAVAVLVRLPRHWPEEVLLFLADLRHVDVVTLPLAERQPDLRHGSTQL